MSDSIDLLASALAKAQAEFTIAIKNRNNPFFKSKYADFESIIAATRPSLAKYGLSVVQPPFEDESTTSFLITILMHSSGQWIKSKARHNPPKADIQSLSSYNTYLKRMCYSSLVGVSTGEEDDDAEQAMSTYRSQENKINRAQLDTLLEFDKERQAGICTYFNVNSLDLLTVSQYDKAMSMIKIKQSKVVSE